MAETMVSAEGQPSGSSLWPFVFLLVGGVAIGLGPILVRIADVGPVSSAFWRVALAVPAFAIGTLYARRHAAGRTPLSSGDIRLLVICGIFFTIDIALWHWSIMLTSVANATLLANLNPVIIAVIGFVFLGHRFQGRFLIAMALALGGMVLLMRASVDFGADRVTGDLFGLGAAAMYAGYFLTVTKLRARVSTLTVLLWTSIVTAVVLLPLAVLSGETVLPQSADGWMTVFALALVSQVIGQGLIVYALAHLQPAFSALSLLIQPIVAAAAAWALFAEALGPLEIAGGALVLVGIVVARRSMPT